MILKCDHTQSLLKYVTLQQCLCFRLAHVGDLESEFVPLFYDIYPVLGYSVEQERRSVRVCEAMRMMEGNQLPCLKFFWNRGAI